MGNGHSVKFLSHPTGIGSPDSKMIKIYMYRFQITQELGGSAWVKCVQTAVKWGLLILRKW